MWGITSGAQHLDLACRQILKKGKRFIRDQDGIGGTRKGDEESIALGVHLVTATTAELPMFIYEDGPAAAQYWLWQEQHQESLSVLLSGHLLAS